MRIFYLEDHDRVAGALQDLLFEYEVHRYRNYDEAHAQLLHLDQYDAMILDQSVDGGTGLDIAGRALYLEYGRPIIMFTGQRKSELERLDRAVMHAHNVHYVRKPDTIALLDILEELL